MINATCTCGWTMAGPPADSWEIDEAVAEHDVWCPDNRDWVNDEIEQQADDRDCIIRAIRNTATNTGYGEYVIALIEKSGLGDSAKNTTETAPNPNPQEEVQDMYNTTSDPTASAWCPLWCTDTHEDDWIDDSEEPTRHHCRLIGTMRTADMHPIASDIAVELVQDETRGTATRPYVSFTGDLQDLTLADIDNLTTLLARARQRLIEVV